MKQARTAAAVAAAIAALVALITVSMRRSSAPPEPPSSTRSQARAGRSPAPRGPAEASAAPADAARSAAPGEARGRGPDERRGPDAEQRKAGRLAMVQDAIQATRFPPDSQPLRPDMLDVLRPNRRHETPQPLRRRADGKARDPAREPHVLFTGPRYALTRGDKLEATLEAWGGPPGSDPAPERLPLEVRSCKLVLPRDATVVASVPLADEGQPGDQQRGDLVYSVSVDPQALPGFERHRGVVRLEAEFSAPGLDEPARASLQFTLAGPPPARFVGVSGEQLDEAGLTLRASVEVAEAGHYVFQGLLFDAADKPIGFAVHRAVLTPGRAEVPFLFFGLLFHEAKATAPFVFRTLTGYRLPGDGEADRADLAAWPGDYRTRSYALSQFSDEEWHSEERSRHIQALQDLAEQNPEKTGPDGESAPPPPSATGSRLARADERRQQARKPPRNQQLLGHHGNLRDTNLRPGHGPTRGARSMGAIEKT